MKLFYFISIFLLYLNIFANSCFSQTKGDGQLILLPFPFYGPTTGFGLTLKFMHTDLGNTFNIDSTSFATTKNQLGVFASIGQRHGPFLNRIFWKFKFGGLNFDNEFFGLGNDTDEDDPATYIQQSFYLSPQLGLYILKPLKIFVQYKHSKKTYKEYEDTGNKYRTIWDSMPFKIFSTNELGFGLEFELRDSMIRPKKGIHLKYEYMFANSDLFNNNKYNYFQTKSSLAFYIPVMENFSHASHLAYVRVASSAPFVMYPDIMVRGIKDSRHRNHISFVLQNEERFYIDENWVFLPFVDTGKVMHDKETNYTDDLHFGYGAGLRYIVKNVLVIRLDSGFSKGGEYAFFFNYGHTF